jgi:hypothetical protein
MLTNYATACPHGCYIQSLNINNERNWPMWNGDFQRYDETISSQTPESVEENIGEIPLPVQTPYISKIT